MRSFHVWYCPHSGEGFSLCKRKAVNKRPFFCERSLMTQWEVRAPAVLSATFYRWIKLRTQYNVLLVQIQVWLLLRDHMRLSISLFHLARLNWHRLPPSLPGHQILQRDKTGVAAFVSQLGLLLLLNIFREGLVQSFCIGSTALFWCFLDPYSPTASWDFLQTPQFSVFLHSPSSAKCAIRDDHPCSQCSWRNPSAPCWPEEPLWAWGCSLLPCELQLPKHLALHFPWDTGKLFSAQ